MTQRDQALAMAARLMAIDWRGSDERTRSRVVLMREYLRRAAWWAQRVGHPELWPFFDIATYVDAGVRADPALVKKVEDALNEVGSWSDVRLTCLWALHWAALRDASGVVLPELDDPFEPLIRMYERGGGFCEEHVFIDVDRAGIPRRTLLDHRSAKPVAQLDDAWLDGLDSGMSS
ncbi:hypothetical protein WEI85_09955 [Actinomycetes bacterium KLBMP 9797]